MRSRILSSRIMADEHLALLRVAVLGLHLGDVLAGLLGELGVALLDVVAVGHLIASILAISAMSRPARTLISESARTRARSSAVTSKRWPERRAAAELALRRLRLLLDERGRDGDRVRLQSSITSCSATARSPSASELLLDRSTTLAEGARFSSSPQSLASSSSTSGKDALLDRLEGELEGALLAAQVRVPGGSLGEGDLHVAVVARAGARSARPRSPSSTSPAPISVSISCSPVGWVLPPSTSSRERDETESPF
jgi:hypothetical protein